MRHYFDLSGINSIVESAGIADWNVGRAADWRAVKTAQSRDIDISGHIARQLSADDFQRFERIFVMDRQNLQAIKKIAPNNALPSIMLLANDRDIPDPYHGDRALFEQVFCMIDESIIKIVEQSKGNNFHDP